MPEDLYKKILQIPEGERPPHHYELLNIELFESDVNVIHNAGLQQFKEVRKWQLVEDPETSRFVLQLLEQLSWACTTLEIPEKKGKYDEELAIRLNIESDSELQEVPDSEIQEKEEDESQDRIKRKPLDAKDTKQKIYRVHKTSENKKTGIAEKSDDQGSITAVRLNLEQLAEVRKDREVQREKATSKWKRSKEESQPQKVQIAFNEANLKTCPNCKARMSNLSILCIECGFNLESGEETNQAIGQTPSEEMTTAIASTIWKIISVFFRTLYKTFLMFYKIAIFISITFFILLLIYWFIQSVPTEGTGTKRQIVTKLLGYGIVTDFTFTKSDDSGTVLYECRINGRKYYGKEKWLEKGEIFGRIVYEANEYALDRITNMLLSQGIHYKKLDSEIYVSPNIIKKADKLVKNFILEEKLSAQAYTLDLLKKRKEKTKRSLSNDTNIP